jgi:DNA-binding transcriptional MerR regulator
MTVQQLRPGQVAAAAGVNLETLRYYERRGLLERPERTLGGHRVYPSEAVTLLRIIKAAQRLGFSLTEVGELLDVATHRRGQRRSSELQTRAKAKLAEVEQKITDLTAIRNTLRDAISGECVDLLDCAITPTCPLPMMSEVFPSERISAGGDQRREVVTGSL